MEAQDKQLTVKIDTALSMNEPKNQMERAPQGLANDCEPNFLRDSAGQQITFEIHELNELWVKNY